MTQAVLARNSDLHGEVGGTEHRPYMAAWPSQIGRSRQPVTHCIKPKTLFLVEQDFLEARAKGSSMFPHGPVQPDITGATLRFGGEGILGRKPSPGKKQAPQARVFGAFKR